MSRHTVDLNVNYTNKIAENTNLRRATSTNANDSPMTKKAVEQASKAMESAANSIDKSLQQFLVKLLAAMASGKKGAGGFGVSESEFKRIMKDSTQDFSRAVLKASAAGGTEEQQIGMLRREISKLATALSSKSERQLGVKLDTKDLERSIENMISKVAPKSTGTAIRDLSVATNTMKTMARDISTLVSRIGSMRKSGGGIDITEIQPTITALKKLAADVRTLHTEANKAKESFSALSKEAPEAIKNFNETIKALKSQATKSLTGASQRAADDPKNFAREAANAFINIVKKSDDLRGTGLEKFVKKMEAVAGDFDKFSKAFGDFNKELKKSRESGKISIEGADRLIQSLNNTASHLKQIPKDLEIKGIPDNVDKLFDQLERFSKKSAKITAEIVVDESSFKTEIKKIESKKIKIPADVDVDTRKAYNDTLTLISKLKTEADKKALMVKVQPVIEKLEKAISANDRAALTKELQIVAGLELDSSKAANEIRKTVNLIEGQKAVVKVEIDDKQAVQKAKKASDVIKKTLTTMPSTRTLNSLTSSVGDPRAMSLYKANVVRPSEGGEVSTVSSFKTISKEAQEIKRATEENIKRLSSSLYTLQKQIVETLDKQFTEAGRKWAVVKSPGASASQAFSLSPGGRQWTVQIANMDRLQREMKDFQSSIDVLVKNYKARSVESRASAAGLDRMPELIGQWLKTVSSKEIRGTEGLDDVIKDRLVNIKESNRGSEVSENMRAAIKQSFGAGERLTKVFKQTYAESEARREMQREGFIKNLALPAARATATGDVSFQTVHGAQRALPKFATFETGFEVLYKRLNELGKTDVARGFLGDTRAVGLRPSGEGKVKAEELSEKLIKAVSDSSFATGTERKDYIQKLYLGAARGKGPELERAGLTKASQFEKEIQGAIEAFNKLDSGSQTYDEFLKVMKQMNLTAYDVVKSLNQISSENVYDIIGKILSGDAKTSPLGAIAKQPSYDRPIRNFEKAISEIEGMLPLLETNRPRRGYHQENVVNLLTRTGTLYKESAKEERLQPDQQKMFIKDLNLELNDTIKRIEAAGQSISGIKQLTSLGIPESQAGAVEEYRYGNQGGLQFLPSLKATSVKLYAEDLTSLAPFQQFQQAGRNISNVTNAMADLGTAIETPKLRSEKERALIESGRYGQKGYGYNVVAEMRNTAATFEDQILISGKLADAATSAVKTLVKPSPAGRVRGATVEERIAGTGVTEIKPGDVTAVAKEYMKILGMPEEYKGRADQALIDAVEKTVSVVRGESVEVQQARLAETFLNYFGRKLTTRYGSKGVSITPTGQPENLGDILSQFGGKKIKVDPKATLGYQVAPKSLGQMASELFGDDVKTPLKERLVTSGNKFLIDIFQNTDIVAGDEVAKTKRLYNDFAKAWQDLFGESVPQVGPEGIKALRSAYTQKFGEKAAFDLKPIDVRISSYGAAKRGLQTEFMESIFSNIAGAGAGGVTTLKQLQQPDYERLLKGGGLAQYSSALGYTGAGKTAEELGPELFKMFGGKGSFAEALASGDEKAVIAKRAAALEAASSFYSQVIDEFGKVRSGLVGEKFLQIVEEPHLNPEWQRGQVERGLKGAELNLPAFSAYATIFGEQSNFMKEIQGSLDINANKHWEYLKALQSVQEKDSQVYQNLTKGLKTVDIGELRSFDLSTGVYGKKYTTDELGNQVLTPRSFADTILDIEKFPEAFKLALPTGKLGQKEDFYVPGALARGTYDDPLLAGERGLDVVSRRLTHVVNMAKELETVMANPEEAIDASGVLRAVPPIVGKWVEEAWQMARRNTPEDIATLEDLVKKLAAGLSTTQAPSPALINTGGRTELEYARGFYSTQMGKAQAGEKTQGAALATTISTISDLLIGKKTGTPEQLAAPTGLTRAVDAGAAAAFTKTLGIDLVQGEIDKRVESLQKAKIDYYHTLAETATGKSGLVQGLLFSRKIPAVMGKAVNAVVDKRKDLETFQKRLGSIEERYGESFSEQASALGDVAKTHADAIKGYQKIGVPILGQEELGVTEAFASKIPLEFEKKFKVTGDKGVLAQKPEAVKGTLKDLLKYVDVLQRASKEEGPVRQQEIMDYIENDLVPYIESIRYPFTGTSSVAPFKPKLIEEGSFADASGRALEKNALIVPGIPEGLKELAPILEQVQSRIDEFSAKREDLQRTGGSQEEIARLTSLIRELNAAVSDVIPKYVAQAQKLDFDGDQIEIHAARTADARKDIATHFKRFHEASPGGDIRTQDVFMKRFLAEAANVPTTGPYVLGEAQKAFEKKFPATGGFKFMQSPFLTEGLEYLSSREALGVLQERGQGGDVSNVIKDVLTNANRSQDEIFKIMTEIGGLSQEDPSKYVDNIMKLFETSYTDLLKQVESGIKKQLYETKFGDTVGAQLFKIHTGPETEAIYRIHRMGETAAGFGGGMISGQRKSSDYFKGRFPETKAMGGNPEEEFHTMINEVLRFGIQKGMDVKHAGAQPVIGEMLGHLTRGVKGADELWQKVQNKGDFKELKSFAEDTEKAIKMRLGELSNAQVLEEAKTITVSRGQDASGLDMKSRDELVQLIVEKVGFKGFLEELSILIRKEAVDGLAAQAATWTSAKKQKPGNWLDPVKGDIRQWAETQISKQIESAGGINVRNAITASQIPLYTTRTSTATTAEEYRKYSEKFGAIGVPQEEVSGLKGKDLDYYQTKYKESVATAKNLQRELRSFNPDQPGAYTDMIKGTMDALYKQQAEVDDFISSLVKENYDPTKAKSMDLSERVLSRQGVSTFANKVLDMKSGLRDEVERLSDLSGVPGLSDTELFEVQRMTAKKFAENKRMGLKDSGLSKDEVEDQVADYVDTMVEKAQALKQLDRVVDALSSKKFEGRLLQDIMPRDAQVEGMTYAEGRRAVMQEAKSRADDERKRREHEYAKTLASEGGLGVGGPAGPGTTLPGGGMGMPTGGGPVPVHVVGVDPSVVFNISGAAGLKDLTRIVPDRSPELREVYSKEQELEDQMRAYQSLKATAPTKSMEDDEYLKQATAGMNQTAADLARKRARGTGDLSSDVYKYMLPPDIDPGTDLNSIFKNIKSFQEDTALYQKLYKDIDTKDLSKFPKAVGEAIGKVQKEGPNYEAFIELTKRLKEINPEQFGGKKFLDAWKAYRLAVGDWFVAMAEQARKEGEDLDQAGDIRGANRAYGSFQKYISRYQEFVRRGLGKRTDVYTQDKRFMHPQLAKGAGVYRSQEQIHKAVGGDLGEDQKLLDAYKEIVKGIESSSGSPSKTSRKLFGQLSEVKTELAAVLSDAEKFGRLGPEVMEAWNFDKLSERVTRLRAALQQILKESGDLDAVQKKNIDNLVKYLKNMESLYSQVKPGDTSMGDTGIIPVAKSQTPRMQAALHARNIQAARAYVARPEDQGGPAIGQSFSYTEKIVDQAGQVVKNVRHDFKKYGEAADAAGQKVGMFTEAHVDLIEKMQRVNASFGNAVRRVVMWGAASRLVYGGVAYLSKSLDELAAVESGMAELRMVMNPLETDFNKMSKSATGFAKQYGVPVTDVLKSMKIFAQQGLRQGEVIDRTQTATLASNVTTLNAKDATEALTAAMVVYREEGSRSMRFLDSWSEVEAKHAITAGDMANAIKKSAAAAKTAGFTFDQLNGIVAAIGATTRQTGNEIGTSIRFIARRLFTEEGPKAFAKLPNPIASLTGEGELKPGFQILSELASQWKDLTQAQKLNIATSVGGTRQYNAMLVLMDQWDEVLRGIRNSTNSKGSAERRNLEIMKTYSKQMEQVKAAATELKMELGKVVLPTFKVGLQALKLLTEAVTGIPTPIKVATTGLLLMFGAMAKGVPIIDSIVETFTQGKTALGAFSGDFSKQLKMAKFEITGKGVGEELFGLKSFAKGTPDAAKAMGVKDLHSSFGKLVFLIKSAGDSYNQFLAGGANKVANVGKGIAGAANKVDKFTDKFQLILGGISLLTPGMQDEAIVAGTQVAESFAKGMSKGIEATGNILGKPFGSAAKFLGDKDPGLLKSVAPLAVSIGAAIPAMKAAYSNFQKLTKSAQDFEKAMDSTRKMHENQLKSVRDVIQSYDTLADRVKDIRKASEPETKKRRMELGTYEAPLVGMQKVQKDITILSNQLADSNLNLVVGYDKLGNAVLRSTGSFKSYMKQLESLKALKGVETELEVLGKFITDLTETDGPEKFKVAIKELAESFPVIGDLVARNIKVAPAKALELATEDLNKRINLKQRYPLSTAADADVKRLQEVLARARDAFQESYTDFERVYSNVLSPATLKGLSPDRIQKILSSPTLQKAYELRLNVDPKFKLAPGVKAQDLMGKEILSALNPQSAGVVDATAEFTKANLETAGIHPRDIAKVYSGDIVTLYDEIATKLNKEGIRKLADEFGVSGNQAIVKLKETSDGVFEWVAEYFNTKTLRVEERPFSDIEPFVESIFPLQKIQEDLSYRMEALNTFTAGAAAGLQGITAKDFKKEFNLGERFFSEIPTTTLLQGGFGFRPGAGYGQVPGAENFGKDIQEFYFKPMDELKTRLDQLEKLRLEGIESGDVELSKGMYDEISRLLDILKNNQVVLQFRSVFVDLMKEFSESERVLKQNLAIMENRNKIEKETGGLLRGVSKGLETYDTGVSKFADLTPRQSLLLNSRPSRERAQELRTLAATAEHQLTQLDSIQKALANMDDIRNVARATGAALDKSKLGDFVEQVAKQADDEGPFKELSKINTKVADNTADTVDRLDKLLENQGDPEAIERLLTSIMDTVGSGSAFGREPRKVANALERVAGVRRKAEKAGNQEAVIAANKALDELSKNLVASVGVTAGADIIDKNFRLFRKDFTSDEFRQRAFGGIDPEVFLSKIGEQQVERRGILERGNIFAKGTISDLEDSKEFKKIRKLQEKDGKETILNSRNLAKVQAAIAAASYVEKLNNSKVAKSLDSQVKQLDEQIIQAREAGKSDAFIGKLTEKQVAITASRNKVQKEADFYGIVAAMNASGVAASELGRAFGLTEGKLKGLNVAAIGTFAAMKLASSVVGKELPDSAKKFEQEIGKTIKKVATGEKPSFGELRALKSAGKEMTKDLAQRTKELYGKSTESLDDEIKRQLGAEVTPGTKVSSPEDLNKIAEQARNQAQAEAGGATLKQLVAAYVATGLVDYVSKRTGEKSELNTLGNRMEDQQTAIVKVLEKYPDVAEKVLQDIYKEQERAGAAGEPADLATVTKSLVQDTEGEYKKVVEMISDYNDDIIKSYEKTAKEIAKIQAKAADAEIREADKRAAYSAVTAEKERQALETISKRFSLSNIIQKGLEGYGGDFALPVPKQELTTQQRIYAESSASFRSMIDAYSGGTTKLDAMRGRVEELTKRIAEEADIIRTSDNSDAVKMAKERYKDLTDELKNQINITDEYAKKLQSFANSYMYLERFAASMYQLETALKEVSNQRTLEDLPGFLNFKDSIDRLLGGTHPDAVRAISTEEERMGSRIGMDLRNLRSTQYDVEEARLRDQLREATGQQAIDIRRQLSDLPEQRQRDLYTRDQQRFDEALRRSISPYEEQLGALEKVRTLPGLSGDVQDQIYEYQKRISTALERSTDRMSLEDYSKELEANRKILGKDAYETEKSRLDDIADAGIKSIYRGVPPWEKMGNLPNEIMSAFKEQATTSAEGIGLQANVSDPIVAKIDETNAILKVIAEKEFDLSFEKQGIFSKLFSGKDYVNLSDYMKRATGGHITGPGGPTTDSIPAWLSDGEYVIKAASAKKLGLDKLNYMNSMGKVPGFAEGGRVFGGVTSGFDEVLEALKKGRLQAAGQSVDQLASGNIGEYLKTTGAMGGLAAAEILGKVIKAPIDVLSGIEGASAYFADKGLKGALGDAANIFGNIKQAGFGNVAKSIGSSALGSLKDEIMSGGTGITAGIISSIAGAGAAKYAKGALKTGKAATSAFVPAARTSKIVVGEGIDVSKQSLNILDDMYNSYKGLIPGVTDKDIGLINIVDDLGAEGNYLKQAAGKSVINIDKSMLNDPEKLADVFRHELFHGYKESVLNDALSKGVMSGASSEAIGKAASAKGLLSKYGEKILGDMYARPKTMYSALNVKKYMSGKISKDSAISELISEAARTGEQELQDIMVAISGKGGLLSKGFAEGGAVDKVSEYFKEKLDKANAINDPTTGAAGRELITKFLKKIGLFPEADSRKAGSYLESGKDKVARYDKMIEGYAEGGIVGYFKEKLNKANAINDPETGEAGRELITKFLKKIGLFPEADSRRSGSYLESGKDKVARYDKMIEGYAAGGAARYFSAFGDDITEYTDEEAFKSRKSGENYIKDLVAAGRAKKLAGREWALDTLQEVNDKFLAARRERGVATREGLPENLRGLMADEYMGIGAQYDTDMFRTALSSKKAFQEQTTLNKDRLETAKSDRRRLQAREAGMANFAGMPADYNVLGLEGRRQLVRLDNDPVAYQSKYDLRLLGVDPSYDPTKNLAAGVKGTSFMSDASYATSRAQDQKNKADLVDSLLGKKFTPDELAKTPYYIAKIKKNYDLAQEVYQNFDDIKSLKFPKTREQDKKTLAQMIERNKGLLERFQSGENPMSEQFMADFRLASMGGVNTGTGLGGKIAFDKDNPAYAGLLGYYLYKMRGDKGLFSLDTRTGTTASALTEEQKKTKAELDKLNKIEKIAAPSRVTQTMIDEGPSYMELMRQRAEKGVEAGPRRLEFAAQMKDFFASLFNRSPEAKHNGGVVHRTGLVFAKGGEVIGYQNGGEVTTPTADKALNASTVRVDASELLSKLESIELKVEDKTLSVEDRELKVENKTLSVEDKTVKIDVADVPKLTVEQPTWKIAVDDTNVPTVAVAQPDWKIGVDVPTDKITVDINIGDAATRLNDAITSALNNAVKVEVTGAVGNAVGGEKFDQLAQTVSQIGDRLITVKSDLENKIKLISPSNNQTIDIDRRVASLVDTKVANLQKDLNDIKTSVGSLESSQRQKDTYYEYKMSDLDYRLKNAMNITGIGAGGVIS